MERRQGMDDNYFSTTTYPFNATCSQIRLTFIMGPQEVVLAGWEIKIRSRNDVWKRCAVCLTVLLLLFLLLLASRKRESKSGSICFVLGNLPLFLLFGANIIVSISLQSIFALHFLLLLEPESRKMSGKFPREDCIRDALGKRNVYKKKGSHHLQLRPVPWMILYMTVIKKVKRKILTTQTRLKEEK